MDIREGIRNNILIAIKWAVDEGMTDPYLDMHVDEVIAFLHSQGVVQKVEGELPEYLKSETLAGFKEHWFTYDIAQKEMLKAGYTSTKDIG